MNDPIPNRPALPRHLVLVDFDPGTEEARVHEGVDAALRHEIFEEVTARAPSTELSVAVPHGPFEYFARQDREAPYPVYCRRPRRPDREAVDSSGEEILLDVNALAGTHPYLMARIQALASDHRSFVYAVDFRGDERWDLWLRDLTSLEPDRLLARDVGPTAVLAADDRTLFYTLLDAAYRPWKLVRRDISQGSESEVVVYEEHDAAFSLHVSKTESNAFIVLTSRNVDTSELHYLPAKAPADPLRCLHERRPGVRFAMTHLGRSFFVLTNRDHLNFELLEARLRAPEPERWRSVLPHREGVSLERIQAFADHLVLYERRLGTRRLRILESSGLRPWDVPLPDVAGTVFQAENREFESTKLLFGFSSLTLPYSIYELDLVTRKLKLVKQASAGPAYDPRAYRSVRLAVESKDGCLVPISLVYRKDLLKPEGNPLLLHGYGAYGYCLEPEFDSARLSLLDRGVIYAIAHVRGGGEMGPAWHLQGKRLHKRNSIEDFLACARSLAIHGYAASDRIAALGESAGGLLVAAAMQQEPELFTAVVADCPFIDVIGSLEDESLPLAISDRDEWGNPLVPVERAYMSTYVPLANLAPKPYPAVLVMTALEDPWVPWQQAAEWAFRLREIGTSWQPVLLHIDAAAGHRGPSGRDDFAREVALKYAFVLQQLRVV